MPKPGTVITTKVNRFDGGIVSDSRDTRSNVSSLVKHFDIFTRPFRLSPHRGVEDGNSAQTSQNIRKMLYYNSKVFGIGAAKEVYSRSDLTGNTWTVLTNGTAASGTFNSDVFVEYQGYGYGWYASANIWKVDLADSAAFTNTDNTVTGVGVQGLVHSKDDILYMPYNASGQGFIASNNAGTWNDTALTLPKGRLISSVSEYGNYLAIATKPQYYGNSVVYLWDRDSSLTTLSESIDFGSGNLELLEEIDGYLIGISIEGALSTAIKPRIVFRRYSGGKPTVFKELQLSSAVALNIADKQKVSSRLYFLMGIELDGVELEGVWSVGRSSQNQEFTVSFSHDPVAAGGTAVSSLNNFLLVGDYMFVVYNNGADTMSKTSDNTVVFNVTSIYESQKFDNEDASLKKQLKGVSVTTAPLPSASSGQIVLKYRVDEETSWTTIFTNSTANSLSHSAVNIESTGASLPEYNEIQFRIESTGNAEITSLMFDAVITGKRPY